MKRTGFQKVIAVLVVAGGLWAAALAPARAQLPSESDVYVDRGILAHEAKQYNEALQDFQEALRLSPDNINALYYTGLTYTVLQQPSAAQAVLEQARKLAPGDADVAFQLGVVYFLQQQYDRAEPLFRQVYAGQPRRPNLGYYLGFIEYRKQAYQEALGLFRATVPSDENFAQLTRFYAGLSLSALGFAGQARSEIEEALRLQPASPLTAPAERFREVLGPAVKAERNFHIDAKVGVYYDSNVAVVPGPSGDIVAQAARQASHKTSGELGYLRFEYLPLRTPDWEASVSASVLQTVNNEVSGFNTTDVNGGGALAYKTTIRNIPTVGGLNFAYDYFALSGHSYLNQYSLIPFMSMLWDATNLSQLQFKFQGQDFIHQTLVTPEDNRNGFDYMAGVMHFFRFQGDQHFLKLGYQFDWDKTRGDNWTYFGNRFLVGAQYTLPWWGIRIRDDFDAHLRSYRSLHSYLPPNCAPCVRRNDKELNNLLSVSKDLPYNITLSLEYLFDRNFSNLALYDYTRHVVSLNASWRY
jgi:tetratricopeptide (TPR) repeat protein